MKCDDARSAFLSGDAGQPELEDGARMILESGQRGAELTGQLLDFSRKMPRRWKPLSR